MSSKASLTETYVAAWTTFGQVFSDARATGQADGKGVLQ